MSVVIIGLPQAMAKVAAIPAIAETVGEKALDAGKLLVAAEARARAPRRTGALASSIVPVTEGVAAVVEYARFPEFGTRYMAAEPFLRAALAERAGNVSDLVGNTVKTALYAL